MFIDNKFRQSIGDFKDSSDQSIKIGDRVRFRGKYYTINGFEEGKGRFGTARIKFGEKCHTNEIPDEASIELVPYSDVDNFHVISEDLVKDLKLKIKSFDGIKIAYSDQNAINAPIKKGKRVIKIKALSGDIIPNDSTGIVIGSAGPLSLENSEIKKIKTCFIYFITWEISPNYPSYVPEFQIKIKEQ